MIISNLYLSFARIGILLFKKFAKWKTLPVSTSIRKELNREFDCNCIIYDPFDIQVCFSFFSFLAENLLNIINDMHVIHLKGKEKNIFQINHFLRN